MLQRSQVATLPSSWNCPVQIYIMVLDRRFSMLLKQTLQHTTFYSSDVSLDVSWRNECRD